MVQKDHFVCNECAMQKNIVERLDHHLKFTYSVNIRLQRVKHLIVNTDFDENVRVFDGMFGRAGRMPALHRMKVHALYDAGKDARAPTCACVV